MPIAARSGHGREGPSGQSRPNADNRGQQRPELHGTKWTRGLRGGVSGHDHGDLDAQLETPPTSPTTPSVAASRGLAGRGGVSVPGGGGGLRRARGAATGQAPRSRDDGGEEVRSPRPFRRAPPLFPEWGSTIEGTPATPTTRFPAGVPMLFVESRSSEPSESEPTGVLMPDMPTIPKAEIARLASRKVWAEFAAMKKAVAKCRGEIAELKRRLDAQDSVLSASVHEPS